MGLFSPDTVTDYVRRGDLEGARRRLELRDDVNERRGFKSTPLMDAAAKGNIAMLELLLEHGANMELVNSSRLTALHEAINGKKTAAAILLAQRGANANKVGFMGRTPLHCAIKRNLLEVTAELLANGADPMVRSESGKVAKAFIQSGPDHDKFVELLDAYANVEAVGKSTNADAMSACWRNSVASNSSVDLLCIDDALEAKHLEAVATILRATLSEDVLEDMLSKYRSIQVGIKNTDDDVWRSTLTELGEGYERDLLIQVMQTRNTRRLQELLEGIGDPEWIQIIKLRDCWTSLHLAASLNACALVQYLLIECGLNPLSVGLDGKLPLDIALDSGADNELCWMLLQHMKKRAFSDRTAMLLNSKEVTLETLTPLLAHLTSVYDLRHILSLGFRALSQAEMHAVLLETFEQVIREKLVFDDRAAVFFKMGLQECRRQEFISDAELVEWDLKATKVNVENSEWVREIKRSLHDVECRVTAGENNVGLLHSQLNALREALIQNEEFELKRRARDRLISLVSSALAMCGGLVIRDIFGAVFDLWDPTKLLGALTTMNSSKMADFLAEKTSTFIFKDGVEAVLIDSDVDPVEFAVVLRDAVQLERAGTSTIVKSFPQPHVPPDMDSSPPLIPAKNTILRFKAIVLAAVLRTQTEGGMAKDEQVKVCRTSNHSTENVMDPSIPPCEMGEADLESYPYHDAVRFSEGDLEQFEELVQYIEEGDGNINDTIALHIRRTDFSDPEAWETILASPLVYASYMGYVEITKWFLKRTDVVTNEKKFLTIKRARSSAKGLIAVRL